MHFRFLPDRMMREQDMPRTVSLLFLTALTFLACLLNTFAGLRFFGISSAVTGFAFGGIQGVVPAITSEIFGLKSLATNYALLQLGPACSAFPSLPVSILLATKLQAYEIYVSARDRSTTYHPQRSQTPLQMILHLF